MSLTFECSENTSWCFLSAFVSGSYFILGPLPDSCEDIQGQRRKCPSSDVGWKTK